ncbi:cyclophilin-like fold protein [Variovorax sp. J31P207]|uniref:cyclophilin-like fold protein n=1 Tax=Variovorax sp. J31P207 TaxID=3053510 RepID=UPI002574A695|nr:cyclophilin-like fold protein [Variovorax sp. J31P207]MDM0065907.1 cyclophilin-like fold protein [Variovorax sp. J31P207]
MKIHLKLNGQVIPATLADNRAAQEFVAMLPLTLTLHDLFRREKFGPLPSAVSATGTRTQAYEVGDMICWAPGPDLAILYRQDGQAISGGFHVLGRIDAGVEAFAAPGPIEVTIEVPAGEVDEAALAVGARGLRSRSGPCVIGGRCS